MGVRRVFTLLLLRLMALVTELDVMTCCALRFAQFFHPIVAFPAALLTERAVYLTPVCGVWHWRLVAVHAGVAPMTYLAAGSAVGDASRVLLAEIFCMRRGRRLMACPTGLRLEVMATLTQSEVSVSDLWMVRIPPFGVWHRQAVTALTKRWLVAGVARRRPLLQRQLAMPNLRVSQEVCDLVAGG
jgi:hypothetical protein